MTTSDGSWSAKLRKITELERPDHYYLDANDECYYFGEYTSGKGYAHSNANQLIHNLKKCPTLRGTAQWQHKINAIQTFAKAIVDQLNKNLVNSVLLVPIPTSKPIGHEKYDDRIVQVAGLAEPFVSANLLCTVAEREANHRGGARDMDVISNNIEYVNSDLVAGRDTFILVDDVVTTGCSFKACKSRLLSINGINNVIGIFAVRRVIQE